MVCSFRFVYVSYEVFNVLKFSYFYIILIFRPYNDWAEYKDDIKIRELQYIEVFNVLKFSYFYIILIFRPVVVWAEYKDDIKIRELQYIENFIRNIDEPKAADHVSEIMSELEEFSEKCRLISVHISGPEITRLNKAIQKVDDLAERYGGKKDLELSRINTDTGIKGLW